MATAQDVEAIKVRALQRESAVRDAMMTQEGTALLRALEELFYDCDLIGSNVEDTYVKLGRRQVVVYLREARAKAQRE